MKLITKCLAYSHHSSGILQKTGSVEDLITFFQENSTPIVGHRTKKNVATRYTQFPLVVVYYNVDFSIEYREGTQYWRKKVELKLLYQTFFEH